MRITDNLTPDEEKHIAEIDLRYRPMLDATEARLDAALKLYSIIPNEETAANLQSATDANTATRAEWLKERGAVQAKAEIRVFEKYAADIGSMLEMVKEEIPRHIAFMWSLSDPGSKPTAEQKTASEKKIAEEEAKILEAIAHNEALLQTTPDDTELLKATEELRHMYHSGEWKTPYLSHYEVFFSDDAIRENINEGFSRYLQHLSANAFDEYKKILAYIELCIRDKEIIVATAKQPGEKEPAQHYRTEANAGNVMTNLPTTIASPTFSGFQYATSLYQEGNAYLQPLRGTEHLIFRNGAIYFNLPGEIRKLTEVELQNIKTKEGIQALDLPLLRTFYSIILQQFQLTNYQEVKDVITLYVPILAENMGMKRNLSKEEVAALIAKTQTFHNIIGVLHSERNGKPVESLYPVLNFEGYNNDKNTISFSSPYMNMVIRELFKITEKKDKKGKTLLKRNGEPMRLPSHSFLVNFDIATEKNKAAAENVFIICTLIERAGDNLPRIRASTIIERNPQLAERLESTAQANRLLQRVFTKTWELLREKTRLTEVYKNIVLPDPTNPAMIPTMSNLREVVFSFPHEGKSS